MCSDFTGERGEGTSWQGRLHRGLLIAIALLGAAPAAILGFMMGAQGIPSFMPLLAALALFWPVDPVDPQLKQARDVAVACVFIASGLALSGFVMMFYIGAPAVLAGVLLLIIAGRPNTAIAIVSALFGVIALTYASTALVHLKLRLMIAHGRGFEIAITDRELLMIAAGWIVATLLLAPAHSVLRRPPARRHLWTSAVMVGATPLLCWLLHGMLSNVFNWPLSA